MSQKKYPDSLTIGEVIYKVSDTPELKKFFEDTIEVTATTEKTKLYADIEKHKTEAATANEKVNEGLAKLQQALSWNQTAEREIEKYRKQLSDASSTGTFDTIKMAEVVEQAFKTHIPPMLQMYLQPVNELTAEMKNKSINGYRDQRIAEMNGELFIDLVTGKTPDEIDQSILKSHELWVKNVKPLMQQQQPVNIPVTTPAATTPVNTPVTTPVVNRTEAPERVIVPTVNRTQQPALTDVPDIKSMSPEEFARQRDVLLGKVGAVAAAYTQELASEPAPQN